MLKSVFSKYLLAFLIIIGVSFLVISGITSTLVTRYSADAKRESVNDSVEAVVSYVGESFQNSESNGDSFSRFTYFNRTSLRRALSLFAAGGEDLEIFVTDERGALLLGSSGEDDRTLNAFPASFIETILNEGSFEEFTDLDGLMSAKNLISARPITDKNDVGVGAVIVCSSSRSISGLVETMMKTILASCLWVMTAAMIIVYFVSEKISSPLREMSQAAKAYAAGKFDVRVPVHGSDEVAELATAFNNMANSLATAEDTRRSFLANVSHDLRTPMTTIAGFIDGILDGAIPQEKQPYYLELIASEVRRLSRLVSSLLDISRIQAGDRKFTKTAFDICEMARQILISFEQRIDEKKLNIEFDCERDNMMVYADRDAIYQVLYNICDNAVKLTAPGGDYRIKIINKDKKTYVSVWNAGQGIPENDLPFVFDRFYKSDKSRGLDKTGVGLGLYITKTIIDAHNEEIWVKSVWGQYCEFVFTLQSVIDN
ncbi:MAG: cell wall metabolism sensor histidine kinase WalK [Clostridia bacterium]|nr:cell wall metabolism sensor histidine kinase WalK [Clostridia bacterium]